MQTGNLIITVSAPDRPGVIRSVSQAVLSHNGNWAESSFSVLAGIFVGIVRIEIAEQNRAALVQALDALSQQDIRVQYAHDSAIQGSISTGEQAIIKIEANDREGIIEEITSVLAQQQFNIIDLESHCESASMAGYNLFVAEICVGLPENRDLDDLGTALENISDDLMVTFADA